MEKEKKKKRKKKKDINWFERDKLEGFFTVALEHEQCQGKFTWLL